MQKVLLRPTIPSDLDQIVGEPLPHRIRALTAEVDGRVIGIGGLGFQPDGAIVAFVQMLPEARAYPVTMHRAALATIKMATDMGLRRVVAFASPDVEPAERWLMRLGFAPMTIRDKKVFVWAR